MSETRPRVNQGAVAGCLIAGLLIAGGVGLATCRIDVPTDRVLIATKLTGEDLPMGEFIAVEPTSKGVSLAPYNEGFHWFNPYVYDTEIVNATIVNSGEVGVLIRQFGKDQPADTLLATPGYGEELGATLITKGILEEPLKPGKYNINTRAYMVEKYPAMKVPPGFVGVSVMASAASSKKPDSNPYVAPEAGKKGISPTPRQPGTYYINPYVEALVLYEVRAQRLDFRRTKAADDSIDFQSSDAFTLNMEGTIEWSVDSTRAPELLARLGEMENMPWPWEGLKRGNSSRRASRKGRTQRTKRRTNTHNTRRVRMLDGMPVADLEQIEEKILVPYTRSMLRVLGAKYKASEYISGERRMEIQTEFRKRLTEKCKSYGILIGNVAIRKIVPPALVKQIINDRSQQQEKRNKILQDIEKIKSDAQLAKKRETISKSQRMVEARTAAEKERIRARQERNEKLKQSESALAVAKINRQKAETERSVYEVNERAKIDQDFKRRKAEIDALALEVTAAGGGTNYIRSIYLRKLGLGLRGIMTSDDSIFMQVFEEVMRLQEDGKKAPKGEVQ